MADEDLAIAPSAPETASDPAATTPADEPQIILEPGEEPIEATPAEIEVIEIEWDDGNKYQIPKALEAGLLKNKDYTEKSQANATTKKDLEAVRERLTAREQAIEAETTDRAELFSVTQELKKYDNVDWLKWVREDPGAVAEHKLYVDQLNERKRAAEGRLKEVQTNRSREAQQDYAKRVEDTKAFAEKLQGWTPEIDNKIQAFVTDVFRRHGAEDAAIQKFVATNLNPAFYDLAHKAWIGEQTLSKTTTQKIPTIPALTTVKAGGAPAGRTDLASADMDAYVAARRKGVGGKPLR